MTPPPTDVFTTTKYAISRLSPHSRYTWWRPECAAWCPGMRCALMCAATRPNSVPRRCAALVILCQRFEGCSDREAVDRFAFDARWKYAAGGLSFDYPSLCIRCWSICAPGFRPRSVPTGSSRRCLLSRSGRGWSAVVGCWTPRRCRRGRDDGHGHADPLGDPRAAGRLRSSGWRASCASCSVAMMITRARGSRCAITRILRRGRG